MAEARRSNLCGRPARDQNDSGGRVRLENGLFRRSKQRWYRWVGRIVLIEQVEAAIVYTVKVHGEEWTLKPDVGHP